MSIFVILWIIAESRAVELSGSLFNEKVGSLPSSERNLQSWNCYDRLHSKSFGSNVLLNEQNFVAASISSGSVLGCFLSCTNGDAQLYINFGDSK